MMSLIHITKSELCRLKYCEPLILVYLQFAKMNFTLHLKDVQHQKTKIL